MHLFGVALLSFAITLALSLSNATFEVLGFADAAEFALCSSIQGIAHPPGFPAYVFLSSVFTSLSGLFGLKGVAGLVVFSAFCQSLAAAVLFLCSMQFLKYTFKELSGLTHTSIALCTSLAPITGTTLWHWSHSVEVYSLQVLATSLVLLGLTQRETGNIRKGSILTGIGVGIGLSNHHLSMILLLPFLILLWPKGWLLAPEKNIKTPGSNNPADRKELMISIGIVGTVLLFFYGWMWLRSGEPLTFAFGSPDSPGRFLYHLSGGAWIKNTQATVKGIAALRSPYFFRISFEQFFFCGLFLVLGVIYLLSSKRYRLGLLPLVFYLVFLAYQLRIDQTADTDAYLCAPFFLLYIPVTFGMARVCTWHRYFLILLPLFIVVQGALHFSKTDLRDFDLSTALLNDLDESAAPGSIVLLADWTSVINYHYARETSGFRKDLCVLNYDIKFTHYDLFRRNQPFVYKAVQPQYDRYIALLEKYHPEEIYNTGCTLDQRDLLEAYLDVIRALRAYCIENNKCFMADPKAFLFLSQQGQFPSQFISGCLVADKPGQGNDAFLKLNHRWLKNEHALSDPSAADKLVDLEAALDFQRIFWKQTGDTLRYQIADTRYREIKSIQQKMKKRMKFLFRPS